MKTNIKGLFLAGLAALAVGCTDLDVDVDSQYTEYPTNEIAVEAKMADIYYHFSGVLGRRYMEAMCLSSDEWTAASYGGGWYDGGAYAHPALHNYTFEDATIDWFGTITEGISKANKAILDLGGNEAGEAVAPARAIRAYFHWIIMDGWGDVPILDRIPEAGETVARQPRAEVTRWLEKELLEVIPQLTTEVSENTYGKPTRWMAEALLAKIYINWPVYTAAAVENYDAATAKNEKLADCIRICDDIINSGKFNLGSMSYREKFSYNNGPSVEDFIYAMPFDTNTRQGMQYGRSRCWKNIKKMTKSYFGMALSQSGGGYMTMTPEFSKIFYLQGDERNKCVIGLSDNVDDYRYVPGKESNTVYVYNPSTLQMTNEVARIAGPDSDPLVLNMNVTLATPNDPTLDVGDNNTGYCQGCRSVKWYVVDDDFKNGRNQSNDIPLFRFADVLLMKAEALTRQGSSPEARNLFNMIRTYAKAPALDHNPTLDEIYEERGREFFDENWRRNDMIRFGHFEDEYFPHYKNFPTARFEKTCRIFPIHKDILNLNPSWKQNAGY
ncbi:MAG: RagB/SusD family nutrient uptake outer membrane protein [Prevotella sp.]|nr:RagB/SusD family nutrient uptake outer membrane protein [Prevotella sp.]